MHWGFMSLYGRRQGIVSLLLFILMLIVVGITIHEASAKRLDGQLPGPMARHRDAMAIAISYVQFNHWDGYSSLRAVNRTLVESGMSLRPEDSMRVGVKDYFEFMRKPNLVNLAIEEAIELKDPLSDGAFFMQDEKGMVPLYILSFKLFGVEGTSLFKGHISLVLFSLSLAFLTFWRTPWAVFIFLVWACMNLAMMLTLGDQSGVDVNLIQGDRFTGILALVPTLHIVLLMVLRFSPKPYIVLLTLLQGVLLTLLFIARITTLWQALAIFAIAFSLVSFGLLKERVHKFRVSWQILIPIWPVVVVSLCITGVVAHHRTAFNPEFAKIQQEHPIWHNVMTVVHNNPQRTTIPHSIPEGIPVWDDQVSYLLFEREIKERGESVSEYLRNDKDWHFRTSEPRWDFLWGKYDKVMHGILLRTISESPFYSIASFLWYQPLTVVKIVFSDRFLKPRDLLHPAVVLPIALGIYLLGTTLSVIPWGAVAALSIVTLFSFIPVLLAAASELRVAEPFAVLLFFTLLVTGLKIAKFRNRKLK